MVYIHSYNYRLNIDINDWVYGRSIELDSRIYIYIYIWIYKAEATELRGTTLYGQSEVRMSQWSITKGYKPIIPKYCRISDTWTIQQLQMA